MNAVDLNETAPFGHPMPNRMLRPPITGFLSLMFGLQLGLGQATAATAETGGATPVSEASTTAPTALWVDVIAGPAQLQPDAVRSAIERELALPVVASSAQPHVGSVQVRGVTGPAVIVRYESLDHTTKLERRVALPVDAERRSLVVAWVVGNLVRNEAAEILAGLANRKAPVAATSDSQEPANQGGNAGALPNDGNAPSVEAVAAPKPEVPPRLPPAAKPAAVRAAPSAVEPRRDEPDFGRSKVINLAVFSPVAALDRDAVRHRYHLSFGAAYSHIGALKGFGLSWFVDHVDYDARGAEIAGIWAQSKHNQGILVAGIGSYSSGDLVGADVTGIVSLRQGCLLGAQVTGVWANSGGSCQSVHLDNRRLEHRAMLGIQVTGIGTYSGEAFRGAQVTGVVAIANGPLEGTQLAGGVAYTRGNVLGAQVTGAGNIAQGSLRGTQLSGVFNVANGRVTGLQATGGLNVAGDLSGMQLGVVNLARDVDGLQLGLVNVARENRGFAIGLFNWAKGVRVQPTYFYQSPYLQSIGIRTILGHATSSMSFGYDGPRDIARTHFAVGARTGTERIGLGLEFGYGWVLEHVSSGPTDRAHELDLIGTVTLEVIPKWLSIYGGGGLAMPVSGVVPLEPRGLGQVGISFF